MKTTSLLLVIVGVLVAASGIACGHMPVPGGQPIVLAGKVNSPFVSDRGGLVYLQLSVHTPRWNEQQRKPLNVAVVIDRSGSMADEGKIDYAKSALRTLINQLTSDDIFSLVSYDDVIEVIRPAGRIRDKQELFRAIEDLYPRGSTNLGGGMIEGFRQVRRYASSEYVNRVILLSDGLANQGITSPSRLSAIAREQKARSISLTTMGVGLDYNENLMVALAENGGGSYYFIESPRSIAHLLHREFESLSSVLCQNAVINLQLGPNVTIKDVVGYTWNQKGTTCEISLGDLLSEASNDITLELQVPGGNGTLALAEGSLRYDTDKEWLKGNPSFSSSVQYTHDTAVIEEHRDLEVQAKGDVAVSTRKVEKAMEALDEGKAEEASKDLDDAKRFLSSSPAAGAAGFGAHVQAQAKQIGTFQSMITDSAGDMRRAKKAIQYDNYKTQKNK